MIRTWLISAVREALETARPLAATRRSSGHHDLITLESARGRVADGESVEVVARGLGLDAVALRRWLKRR